MFSFLRKSDKVATRDKVWKSREECLNGLAAAVAHEIQERRKPLVLTFFEESRKLLADFLTSGQITFEVLGESGNQPNGVVVSDALVAISPANLERFAKKAGAQEKAVIFFGHYPLIQPEQEVLEKIQEQLKPSSITFCVSLDDGILQHFGAEKIKPLMETLGMADNECIEHSMVTKSIANARRKLSEKVTTEMKSRSESEWFSRNMGSV